MQLLSNKENPKSARTPRAHTKPFMEPSTPPVNVNESCTFKARGHERRRWARISKVMSGCAAHFHSADSFHRSPDSGDGVGSEFVQERLELWGAFHLSRRVTFYFSLIVQQVWIWKASGEYDGISFGVEIGVTFCSNLYLATKLQRGPVPSKPHETANLSVAVS